MSKRKGNLDKIMVRHVETCAELENLQMLKEALLVYRNLVQNSNPQSLQMVLEKLRGKVEERVSGAMKTLPNDLEIMDLEAEEAPEALLLNCVRPESENSHQSVTNSLRFLWEIYKISLDLLKTNGRMVAAYRDSAISAISFCEKYKRPSECRKLSEILRQHLQNIIRIQNTQGSASLTYMMRLDEDTLQNLILIREKLMDVCMDLDLWQETYRAAEDTRQLICEGKASPSTLAKYWLALSKIFWKAGQSMFHAYALYLYYYQNKKHNKKFNRETSLASSIVLATLAVPTFRLSSDVTGITTDSILSQEINMRLSTMLLQTGMITREQLIDLLHTNNLLELASKEVRDLFFLLENKFSPLNLSNLVKPLLAKIKDHSEYKIYVPFIEQLLVGRVLAQLSKCYRSLKLATLGKLIDFIPAEILEKYILEVSIKSSLYIKIDHSNSAIYFKEIPDILEACTKFNKVKQSLVKAHGIIMKEQEESKRKYIMRQVFGNLEEISFNALELRQSLTDDGKKLTKERDEMLRKREEEEKRIREIEKRKFDEELRQREKTQKLASGLNDIERERRSLRLLIINSVVEKMRGIGFSSKEMSYNGKKIERMTEDELLVVGPEELSKLYGKLYDKSVRDKQIQVKQQQKSLEYNERAKREYMNPLILEQWAESTEQEIESKKNLIKEKYEKDLIFKKQFERIQQFKAEYIAEETAKAEVIYKEVHAKWFGHMKEYYKFLILEQAKKRREDEKLAKKEDEERMKNEQERRKKAEENRYREIPNWRPSQTSEKTVSSMTRSQLFSTPSASSTIVRGPIIPPSAPAAPSATSSLTRNTNFIAKPVEKLPEKSGFVRNTDFAVEERKAAPISSGPPKRFINTKKKPEPDKDGFTVVTKDVGHHN